MKDLDSKYNHHDVEKNKYDFWLENHLFDPKKNIDETFSIILPPPNVTGKLHLGHAWDVSLQDILIRYNILNQKNVLWVPGTDHAGIATQTKFEKILKDEQKLTKDDLGRNKFVEQIWKWSKDQSDFIHSQWKKMGIALSYDYEKFTMDKDINEAVNYVFVKLYNDKKIYRKKKMVNWDPILKTAISNIEVIHKEVSNKMYYFKYFSEDKKDCLIVATTRPETMFGDVCLVVNPNDNRYKNILNKKFINPANDQLLPIICDDYIDINFGTGVMKCTPAHDFNDYEIGLRHNLDIINILNPDGTIVNDIPIYGGMDRFECRNKLVDDISQKGLLDHIENVISNIGFSERTNTVVEPYLSWQWFVDMKPLIKDILKNQKKLNNAVQFVPPHFNNNLIQWLENIEDWCISRQLWWGHQIPIWYNKHDSSKIYCDVNPPIDIENWTQDNDVLDTWFSSGLWPLVTLGFPFKNELLEKYFPTNVLVTGYDIIFFWVSRMMMFSNYFTNKIPFKNVLIHGLIRDSQGRKMSKSLGNGIDPMDVIHKYGCDSLRLFLTTTATLGEDLNYSEEKIKANWNFINKLWNGARYIFSINNFESIYNDLNENYIQNLSGFNLWIVNLFNNLLIDIKKNMDSYNFVVAFKKIYDFVWDKFFNQYLEITKIDIKQNNEQTINVLGYILKNILIMLHPFTPFVSEELYQCFPNKKISIMSEIYPSPINIKFNDSLINLVFEILFVIRKFKKENDISNSKLINIIIDSANFKLTDNDVDFINKYLNENNIYISSNSISNFNNIVCSNFSIKIDMENLIDKQKELLKLNKQLEIVEFEINRCQQLLFNPNFIKNAPKQKVDVEKEKLAKYQYQHMELKEKISKLK